MGTYKPVFAFGPRETDSWYRIEAKSTTATVYIYEEIGLFGIDPLALVQAIDSLSVSRIVVRMDTPGGLVFGGVAIYHALRRHPAAVDVYVDGLAASISSVIALAGDGLPRMPRGTSLMIHDPRMGGRDLTANDMRKGATILDDLAEEMVGIYAERTGKDEADIRSLMLEETWFTAAKAIAAGWAVESDEEATPSSRLAACWDLSVFQHVPVAVAERYSQTRPPQNVRELETILRDAGLSKSRATAVASHGWQAPEVLRDAAEPAPVTPEPKPQETKPMEPTALDATAQLAAERSRNKEISALGKLYNLSALADTAIEDGTSLDAFRATVLAAIPKPTWPIDPVSPVLHIGKNNEEARPFAHFGDFLQTVAGSSTPGSRMDPRLGVRMAATGSNEGSESDGGFLVDTQWLPGILQDMHENDEIVSRCKRVQIGAGYNGIRANGIDETSRVDGSRFGGVQAYWATEAGTVTATKPKFRRIQMDLEKLLAIYYATDEVLADATALGSLATQAFGEEIRFKASDAVFRGTGAGMPLGILNAGATVSVAKESGQAADSILFENVSAMWARCRARNRSNAVWLVNQECEPELEKMYLPIGTAGVPVWMPAGGVSGAEYQTLKARPVIYVEQASALGDVGDIVLADLSEYLLIEKSGIQQAQSAHVQFLYSEQTFRFTYRVNGQPFRSAPLTPYKGSNTLSPFVTLAARA